MEGVLYKWTNYISGWQPRWFVLESGTLSYYDSQEEAWKGCKGSIKISVCEIQVHPSDFTRVDLTIPGEQYFYLRAINAAERQKWLVALGTAKACLTDNRTKREKELQENTEALKTKMSELRLYCDLLLQQVNKIKDGSEDEPALSTESGEDTAGLVKSTCSTFLKTLEECMQIASRTFTPDLLPLSPFSPPGSPPIAAVKPQKVKPLNQSSPNVSHRKRVASNSSQLEENSASVSEAPETDPGTVADLSPEPSHAQTPEAEDSQPNSTEEPSDPTIALDAPQTTDTREEEQASSDSGHTHNPEEGGANDTATIEATAEQEKETEQEESGSLSETAQEEKEPVNKDMDKTEEVERKEEETEEVETFFSTMSHRFSDITLEEDSGIPIQPFLDSCYAIVPVLDKLGPTVFAPVKIDFVGNIKKIAQKHQSEEGRFSTLQAMVLQEVRAEEARLRNSATEALLWLKRGLHFLQHFLAEVHSGQRDIPGALNSAYGKTLRQYHGWVVRGVFALALRAAPSYDAFAAALVLQEGDQLKEGFLAGMKRDLGIYLPAMQQQLAILDTLYEEHCLESDEVV